VDLTGWPNRHAAFGSKSTAAPAPTLAWAVARVLLGQILARCLTTVSTSRCWSTTWTTAPTPAGGRCQPPFPGEGRGPGF
jgi:hypothetical protein